MRYSIIIPTYERSDMLGVCLESLVAQNLPRERYEVLVVDDGSTRPPRALVSAFTERLTVRLLEQPQNRGPAAARNAGARAATGDVLVFLDDDCIAASNALEELDRVFARYPRAYVGARTVNARPDDVFSTASHLLLDFLYLRYNAVHDQARWFITTLVACPRDLFLEYDGFDETFPLAAGEDRDFSDRLWEAGERLIYAPNVVVNHVRPLKWRSFWKQHFTYGRGAHYLQLGRERRGAPQSHEDDSNFYTELVKYPFRQTRGRHAAMLSLLEVISQVAYVAGYLTERRRGRRQTERGQRREASRNRPVVATGIKATQDRSLYPDPSPYQQRPLPADPP